LELGESCLIRFPCRPSQISDWGWHVACRGSYWPYEKVFNYELPRVSREANIVSVLLHDVVTDLAVSYRSADVDSHEIGAYYRRRFGVDSVYIPYGSEDLVTCRTEKYPDVFIGNDFVH